MKLNSRKLIALCLSILFATGTVTFPLQAQPPFSSDEEEMSNFDPAALPASQGLSSEPDTSRITLELKGVDVLDVLKILASRSALNIVAGKNVRGQVTIYLKDVLVHEALDVIISALGLAYIEDNGIIKVMTDKEYEVLRGRPFRDPQITRAFKIRHADPKAIQQVIQQMKAPTGRVVLDERTNTLIVADVPEIIDQIANAVQELDEPLVTKIYKMEYASVEDLEDQLADYLTPETGIAKVDKRSNQVSVTDRKEKVEQIEKVIKAFDVRPPQVLIEAQVVEVELFDAFRYGIDWDYVRNELRAINNVNFSPNFSLSAPSSSVGGGSLSTFTLGNWKGVSTVFSVLQNVGKTNTLSAPRLTVLNNEEAKLIDATRQPYVTSTVVQGENTSQTADTPQFIDVGVTLTVVPTITDQNTVVLKLKPEVSSSSTNFTFSTASGQVTAAFDRTIPIVSTQTLETTVIVKSGETLVVGGLIKDTQVNTVRKLPILGDLPLLGMFFRSDTVDFSKTELVIFLTPHVVTGDVSSLELPRYLNSRGELVDFDKAGGYDYGLSQLPSQDPFRRDNRPYWETEGFKMPRYFPPRDVFSRSAPYQDRLNQFEGYSEGSAPLDPALLRKAYEQALGQKAIEALGKIKELKDFEGQTALALVVRRDGVLKDVSFVDAGSIRDEGLKRRILQTIREASPFPEFPKGLDSAQELFDLRFGFKKSKK